MSKTRSMTRNWSDLNHDVLYLVMMKLGFGDYYSFRGVCKSWRLLAHSSKNTFMASMPPMSITISNNANGKECYLEDFEGIKLKTILPSFAGGACVGLTCGYLIFFTKKTRNCWLVNPITRHQLHFPEFPFDYPPQRLLVRAILVFSPSISALVFVVLRRLTREIWFSTEGKGAWNCVSQSIPITDLYAFKGKIYTLNIDRCYSIHELRLSPEPKLLLLQIEKPDFLDLYTFVSSGEHLYVTVYHSKYPSGLLELDLGHMKWVKPCEKAIGEYAFFRSDLNHVFSVKRKSWADPQSHPDTHNNGEIWYFFQKMWYFPHQCMNVDCIDE